MAASFPSIAIQELCRGLTLDDDVLLEFAHCFEEDLKRSLEDDEAKSSMNCFLTCIDELPSGREKGQFLALEFCGIVIKVAIVTLKESSFDMRAKQYTISEDIRKGSGTQLFDFLAKSINDFCTTHKLWNNTLMMGFAFGFPYKQKSIRSGILVRWSKEFTCSGVEGKDVVVLLEKAIAKVEMNIKVIVLINNATGTLLSCEWKKRVCRIGYTADWGTNLAYAEKGKNVPKYQGDPSHNVVINTECGNFGANGEINFLRTGWDREMDMDSAKPGTGVFEKMVSTWYLSEVVRRILVTAVHRNIILKGKMSRSLATIDSLPQRHIFDVVLDTVGQRGARKAYNTMGYPTPCGQDCVDLEFVCNTVITRASQLIAASLAGITNHLRYKEAVVGMDGNLLHWMPNTAEQIKTKVMELCPHTQAAMTAH